VDNDHSHYIIIEVSSGDHPPGYPDPAEAFDETPGTPLFAVCSLDPVPRPLA
jgi:hypothetical protein